MVKMSINTQLGQKSPSQVQFESVLQLQYSHIAPGISGFDPANQLYFSVGVRGRFAYLVAIFTGFTPQGLTPARIKWEKVLPGILTSIEVDAVTGDVYGLLMNATFISTHLMVDSTVLPLLHSTWTRAPDFETDVVSPSHVRAEIDLKERRR
jgi:hypothetical protein